MSENLMLDPMVLRSSTLSCAEYKTSDDLSDTSAEALSKGV